jgi:hypothetical protein
MHNDINALLAQAALENDMEFELALQSFLGVTFCFNIQINIATARIVPHP